MKIINLAISPGMLLSSFEGVLLQLEPRQAQEGPPLQGFELRI